ncbi:deoxyribodipyrimidine photo-lyase, partial [Flavobacteriaceae bacterium]|nr:deoxyribodipyrimidine photo-lyase [Flavobacteriaceae bacterium]
MQNEKPTALVWLRNDLRINDQQSFALAAKSKANIVAYYSFDPSHFETTPW